MSDKIMKNILNRFIIKVYISLALIITSSELLISNVEFIENQNESEVEFSPIAHYQKMLSDMVAQFITKYVYRKSNLKKKIARPKKNSSTLSREEALENIKNTTTKLFDLNDPHHISVHLNTMKDLTQHLDTNKDKKTITAIHFLLENQHRSSILADTYFWAKAIKEKELNTSIPMTPEVAKKSKTEMLSTLRKKMLLKIEAI